MNVKGFILEDEQGREFVMMSQQSPEQPSKTFALRGWQRRRLVPLKYPEWELRQIVAGVLLALDDLFKSLPRFVDGVDKPSSHGASSSAALLRKAPVLRKVNLSQSTPL